MFFLNIVCNYPVKFTALKSEAQLTSGCYVMFEGARLARAGRGLSRQQEGCKDTSILIMVDQNRSRPDDPVCVVWDRR